MTIFHINEIVNLHFTICFYIAGETDIDYKLQPGIRKRDMTLIYLTGGSPFIVKSDHVFFTFCRVIQVSQGVPARLEDRLVIFTVFCERIDEWTKEFRPCMPQIVALFVPLRQYMF